MPETYKSLHKDWKIAKKDVKRVYDFWERMFVDMSQAHVKVDSTAPKLPKFDMDLGPSLDKLHANKDVDKYKAKAQKAIKQYDKEMKTFQRAVGKMPQQKDAERKKIHLLMVRDTAALLKVVDRIKEKLDE